MGGWQRKIYSNHGEVGGKLTDTGISVRASGHAKQIPLAT